MKMTTEQLAHYYEAQGIDRGQLASTRPLDLSELPRDAPLTEDDRGHVAHILDQSNAMAHLEKIDAAQAMERRVLQGRDTQPFQRISSWSAYLLLGRLRDSDERREVMRRIGHGELDPASLRPRSPGRRRKH